MSRAKSLNSILLVSASLAASVLAFACSEHHERVGDGGVWFVHASDPHVYLYLKKPDDANEKAIWDYQQKQDAETFKTFLQALATLPQKDGPPAFLLITGDFGVDPCLNPKPATPATTLADAKGCLASVDDKERASRVDEFANLLSASPISDIYFVAGNNDLPVETADDAGLGYFNQFFQDVQSKITAKNANVHLHNLTGCYAPNGGAISNCSQDIPGTSYRMIGFPSQSFKNKDTKYASNQALQSAQYKTFRGFFDQATKDGKKVIIATHIPEMDDPYFLARDRYAGVKPDPSADTDKDNPRSAYSTWNVEKSLLDDWAKVLASDSLVAVLAGHLHDDHKEIYQRPYSWSTLKEHQLGYRKLFLAPPLSVKNQDGSPIQARGFSVVSLKDDHLTNRFYWFDGRTASFTSAPSPESENPGRRHRSLLARLWHWLTGLFFWFWRLGDVILPPEHTATLLIALLTAFLTVIAIWQIPPSDDPLVQKSPAAGTGAQAPTANPPSPTPSPDSSPFTSRYGKTVLAGLGGLVVSEVTKTLGNQTPNADTKWYYLGCFIFFFFVLLFGLNFLRACAEALRTRIAVTHYPVTRARDENRALYWLRRLWHLLRSFRVPLLVFFDTFINLIQGKNQTTTLAFANTLIDQQRNVVRVADAIRKKLHFVLKSKIEEQLNGTLKARDVRVNISVLSDDQSNVFYISRSSGSSFQPFPKSSVAWVSVFTGNVLWYESDYRGKNVRLFDNQRKEIPGPDNIMLDGYYTERQDDYHAFVVIPVPYPRRAFTPDYTKAGIHISFSDTKYFTEIWDKDRVNLLNQSTATPPFIDYPTNEGILGDWCKNERVRTALNDVVAVLGELLRGFNETIYKTYIQPSQTD